MFRLWVVWFAVLAVCGMIYSQSREAWLTTYESSDFLETGTYDEAVAMCRRIDGSSAFAEYRAFGISPEGRELPLLLVDTSPAVKSREEPLVLVIAGIHSGEIDGKDAGLMLIRDCLVFREHPGLLDGIRLAFVPIFNVDGHERRSEFNRINQRGPKEQGWRTTSVNLNLNRDWLKADAVEMRAMLSLIDSLNPDFLMDIHVTDGADFQYVVTYALNMYENEFEPVATYGRRKFLPVVQAKMQAEGLTFVPYPIFKRSHDVTSGWVSPLWEPRYSSGYGSIINRPFILIESHSLKDYHARVTGTYTYLRCAIETIKQTRSELLNAVYRADKLAADLPGKALSLNWDLSGDSTMVKFLGHHSWTDSSKILGGPVTHWSDSAVSISIPLFEDHSPKDSVLVPYAYVIPAPWLDRVEGVLRVHGLEVAHTTGPLNLDLSTYTFSDVTFERTPFEGRFPTDFHTAEVTRSFALPAGSGVIFLDHRKSKAAIHLLEPGGPDSFVKWGFFPSVFEQKEWAEGYAMDTIAARMLEQSPDLQAEFSAKLASDTAFSANMRARVQFLYERSPYWDTRKDVYPIGRLTKRDQLPMLKKAVGNRK